MGINYPIIARTAGASSALTGIAMILVAPVSLYFREYREAGGFALCAAASLLIAGMFALLARALGAAGARELKPRDAMLAVCVWWLASSVLGGLPYIICGVTGSADAVFESVSGFTTTGLTVLDGLSELPRSIILWRSATGWLGGIEMPVVSLAAIGAITHAETLPERIERGSSARLCALYAGLTLLLVLLLTAARTKPFDALILAFGAVSTCGFAGDGGLEAIKPAAKAVLCAFMLLAAVNFTLLRRFRARGTGIRTQYEEPRCFLLIFCSAAVLIGFDLLFTSSGENAPQNLGYAFFEAASAVSTTGFHSAGVSLWPSFCKISLLFLMLTGGCALSASGGVKVGRIVILFRLLQRNISVRLHPNAVLPIKFDGKAVPADTASAIAAHGMLYIAVFAAATLIVSADGAGGESAASVFGVLACMSNAGPGMAALHPELASAAWAAYGGPAKLFFGFLMILGRLEFTSVLMLFTPRYWKND
jgi:trk system potassium uptake protein TrkH